MQPVQRNNGTQNNPEGLPWHLNSEIQTKPQRVLGAYEDPQGDDSDKASQKGMIPLGIHPEPQCKEPIPQKRPFAPLVANTLQFKEVQGVAGVSFGAICYNEKHNMIIAGLRNSSLRFYNANTLLPSEESQEEKLESPVMEMSFSPQGETYLLGCMRGNIYAYNISSKTLQKAQEHGRTYIIAITFINSREYVFAAMDSNQLCIGSLENRDLIQLDLGNKYSFFLYCSTKRNLLFSSLTNGSLMVFRTNQLPKLSIIASIRGFNPHNYAFSRKVQSMTINGKELIVTTESDAKIRIWHFLKGRMRLLRVIQTKEKVSRMIYLDEYKMIATTHLTQEIKFFRLESGKLEGTLDVKMGNLYSIFLMKNKNSFGVASFSENMIKIVQL